MTALEFITGVEMLCAGHFCSVTSWIRTEARNRKVGGNVRSRHMLRYGRAVDLVPDENAAENRRKLLASARALGFRGQDEGDHVHLQDRAPQRGKR